ncbi:hypothetical protein GWI33_003201 [Rhynchophorus ferrugineus]|uniref:Mos1 transposase HTH domain-containing protein n=1 Tax=Rhynchophorus ferrugineus TaxID=354439 RepID=A0A834MLF4_RHYFE|nr:hypothetical protein GWI33_003201 [Rhynchophorus ferrugineus]
MDKKQFCLLIKYCFLKGKNTVEAETWLDAEFPDAAPGKPTKYWYAKFRRDEMSTEDGERSGRPKERNKPEFWRRYVAMYETWLHHFTPKTNWQSSEWTAHDEPAPKPWKMQQSASKVMASVFWNAHEIIF